MQGLLSSSSQNSGDTQPWPTSPGTSHPGTRPPSDLHITNQIDASKWLPQELLPGQLPHFTSGNIASHRSTSLSGCRPTELLAPPPPRRAIHRAATITGGGGGRRSDRSGGLHSAFASDTSPSSGLEFDRVTLRRKLVRFCCLSTARRA